MNSVTLSECQRHEGRKVAIALFIFGIIYSFPLLVGGYLYEDDYQRLYYGYSGWSANGRPLADVIFYLISPGGSILDIYPLGQIASLLICCCIGYLFNNKYNYGFSASSLICASLFFTPLYLESLAYRFDSLTMSVAVLFSVLPFLVTIRKGIYKVFFGSACVIVVLCTYQVAINIFLCFFAINLLNYSIKGDLKGVAFKCLSGASQVISGSIVYKLISPLFVSGNYSTNLSKGVMSSDGGFLSTIVYNAGRVQSLNYSVINSSGFRLYLGLLILLTLFSVMVFIFRNRASAAKISSLLIFISVMVFVYFGGVLLSLSHPVVFPRTCMGLGALLSCCFVIIKLSPLEFKHKNAAIMTSGAFAFIYFTAISYSYANNLKLQHDMQSEITSRILSIVESKGIDSVYAEGLENTRNKNLLNYYNNRISGKLPIISWLTPTIYGRWGWIMGTSLKMSGFDGFKGPPSKKDRDKLISGSCKKSIQFTYCISGSEMLISF